MNFFKTLSPLALVTLLSCAAEKKGKGECGSGTEALSNLANGVDDTDFSKYLANTEKLARYIGGGYIDAKYFSEENSDTPVVNYEEKFGTKFKEKWRRCSFLVGFDLGEPRNKMRIFTSDHCVNMATDTEIKLNLFLEIDGKPSYVPLEVKNSTLEAVKLARQETIGFEPKARERFLQTFSLSTVQRIEDNSKDRLNVGAKRCKALHELSKEGKFSPSDRYSHLIKKDVSHACFSLDDSLSLKLETLTSFENLSNSQKLAIETTLKNYGEVIKRFGTIKTPKGFAEKFGFDTVRTLLEDFYDRNMQIRHFTSVEKYLDLLDRNECSRGVQCTPEMKDKFVALSKKYFPSPNLNESETTTWFKKILRGEKSVGNILQSGASALVTQWLSGKGDMIEKQKTASINVWKLLDNAQPVLEIKGKFVANKKSFPGSQEFLEQLLKLTIHANFYTSDEKSFPKYRWVATRELPKNNSLHTAADLDDKAKFYTAISSYSRTDPFDRVIVISYRNSAFGKNASPFLFGPQDSGSMLGNLMFPFATLSTVDGVPTEGVTLKPLNRENTDSAIAAGASQNTNETVAQNQEIANTIFKPTSSEYVGTGNLPAPSLDRVDQIFQNGSNPSIENSANVGSRNAVNCN